MINSHLLYRLSYQGIAPLGAAFAVTSQRRRIIMILGFWSTVFFDVPYNVPLPLTEKTATEPKAPQQICFTYPYSKTQKQRR
jgi:hypothetical protein